MMRDAGNSHDPPPRSDTSPPSEQETRSGNAAAAMNVHGSRSDRLVSLDAYRGLAMLLMASGGLGLARVAESFPENLVWQAVKFQVEHVPWQGCSLWDLIQPSFMFMVGVAAAYSQASRRARGQSTAALARHAAARALELVLLGIFLRSRNTTETNFTFEDVLTQIGLGYFFVYLLSQRSARARWIAAAAILAVDWLLFAVYPAPGPAFDFPAVGVPADWPYHPLGFGAHWDKNSNFGAAFDTWFLNLFPRSRPFVFNRGGYLTLNFLPSLATMIFGLLAGGLLRGPLTGNAKFRRLVAWGLVGVAAGLLWAATGACPLVKRIWTPSWTIFAAGTTSILLAMFYFVIDLRGWRRWTLPLVVVGMNSIVMYVMAELSPDWILHTLKTHFGPTILPRFCADGSVFGVAHAPLVESSAVLLAMWLVCYWLYRQRIFIRL